MTIILALFLTAASLIFRKAIMLRNPWRSQQLDPAATARKITASLALPSHHLRAKTAPWRLVLRVEEAERSAVARRQSRTDPLQELRHGALLVVRTPGRHLLDGKEPHETNIFLADWIE